ncbi:MAG: CRISPR-associated endonuclease Cas3'', partial [Solirubrobacteraceae bacterium]
MRPATAFLMMQLWAKTGAGGDYLPYMRHPEDIRAVGQRLWDVSLTGRQRAWIAGELGLSVDDARAWSGFLAAVHDIGKVTSIFQQLAPDLAGRLAPDALLREAHDAPRVRHDALGGAILRRWAAAHGLDRSVASRLAAAISGHHGELRSESALDGAQCVLDAMPGWAPHQDAILDQLARVSIEGLPHPTPSVEVITALAGFVSVADWIASDASRFPITSAARPAAADLAVPAVSTGAWSRPSGPGGDADRADGDTFAELFGAPDGTPRPPRATQRAVIDALAEGAAGRLVLIEDRTGSGKTEAALWVVRRALQDGARGVYVGLTT